MLLKMDSAEGEESDADDTNIPESCRENSSTDNDLGEVAIVDSEKSMTNSLLHHISVETDDSETSTVTSNSSSAKRKLKQLVPIFKIFIPLTLFWAIFFQRSSTWIVQATYMDCYLGSLHVPPGKYVLCNTVYTAYCFRGSMCMHFSAYAIM